jgi:hypothetical protein
VSRTIRRTIASLFLLGIALVGSLLGEAPLWQPPIGARLRPPSAIAAPALVGLGDLTFSADVDGDGSPVESQTEFNSSTERVWTTFDYRDYGGEAMSYLVRANGEDWTWGDLDCCEAARGRFAFPIERRSGRDLGGAAYDVFVYASNAEVGQGGFGVRGTRGFDDDDDGDDNDND